MNVKELTEMSQGHCFSNTEYNLFNDCEWENICQRATVPFSICACGLGHWGHQKNEKSSKEGQARKQCKHQCSPLRNHTTTPPVPFQRRFYRLCPNLAFPSLSQIQQPSPEQKLYDDWHAFYFKRTNKTMKNGITGKTNSICHSCSKILYSGIGQRLGKKKKLYIMSSSCLNNLHDTVGK